jgi:hypothetical protein
MFPFKVTDVSAVGDGVWVVTEGTPVRAIVLLSAEVRPVEVKQILMLSATLYCMAV